MTRSNAELERLLRADDVPAINAFFAGACEAERKSFAPVVMEFRETLDLNQRAHYRPDAQTQIPTEKRIANYHQLYPNVYAAALACASLAQLKSLHMIWGLDDEVATILGDRRPPWIAEYAEFLCANRFGAAAHIWRQVRTMVRAGLCPPPTHENYVLGAIEGIRPIYTYRQNQRRAAQGLPPLPELTLEQLLLGERDWLETAFWHLFELEGNSRLSLANRGRGWSEAIVSLSRQGVLERGRLLDASLAALSRDFLQFRAGWFSRFHEEMEPMPEERAARIDTYLALLTSNIPPTVTFALAAVRIAEGRRPLPAVKALPALEPVLAARAKKTVRAALELLERIATGEPNARRDVCRTAVMALASEAPEVQKEVFALIGRHGDPRDAALRAAIHGMAGAVVPSLRAQLKPWLDGDGAASGAMSATSMVPAGSAVAAETKPIPARLDPSHAIAPIATLDELLDRAAAVLEAPENTADVERVLDGMCRLCDQRPADFDRRAGPLCNQAVRFVTRFHRGHAYNPAMEQGLGSVMLSWLGGQDVFAASTLYAAGESEPLGFLFRRLAAIATHVVRGRALPLLSAPTHTGGWIEPATLVRRWLAWQRAGVVPDRHEQVVGLLRLAPEKRADALAAAEAIEGEAGRAVRHALGHDEKPGADAALWLGAYRSRQPHDDLPEFERAHPRLGPDAGMAARYRCAARTDRELPPNYDVRKLPREMFVEGAAPAKVDGSMLPVLMHQRAQFFELTSRPLLQWIAQLWPANREAFFARATSILHGAVSWADNRDRETIGYLEPLSDPHTELRTAACQALVLGLAAKDEALRGHAKEALIAAIAEGRANPTELGAAMAEHCDTGGNKFARWAKSLGDVARVSPMHARAVAHLLPRTLHADPAHAPRDIGAFLELMVEVLSATGLSLTDPEARAYLSSLAGGRKTQMLAKQLLGK